MKMKMIGKCMYTVCWESPSQPPGVWSEVKAALAAHNNDNND